MQRKEIRDILIALGLESPLSLEELYKKFHLERDDEKFEKLKICLKQFKPESSCLEQLDKELKAIKEANLKVVTVFDDDYPQNLKNIFDPPSIIFVNGSLEKSDARSLAIVGSRRATFTGINFARTLSVGLAQYGITIVSGLARGIDTAAHTGCLKAGVRTIAVLGSGFGYMYPATNKKLAQDISEQGAVISEFSYFTKPLSFNFPRRNRIISGLCLGVIVVEAAERSGSLITADLALEQGREVFAVPGVVTAPNSKGTHKLIKQGAVLVENELDVIDALPQHIKETLIINRESASESAAQKLEGKNLEVYNLISAEPICIDAVCQSLKLQSSQALKILLDLQIKGLVQQLPGKLFCRK